MADPKRFYITSNERNNGPFIVINEDNVFNSYGVCSFHLTKPTVNLNKVIIETDLPKTYRNKYPGNFNLVVKYEGKNMKKTDLLGEGTYGQVWKYEIMTDKNTSISVVVKIPLEDIEEEPMILKHLIDDVVCTQNVIPIKTVYDQKENPFIIMQEANSTLRTLKMDLRLIKKIILQITKTIECFYEYDIFYLDLKTENILYICKNDKLSIFLGDIGSFAELGEVSMATFMPPEVLDSKKPKADKAYMFFTLGAFFADLYGLADDIIYINEETNKWKTRKTFINKYYPKFSRRIINSNIPEKIKEVILQYTQVDPKKRSKLSFEMVYDIFDQ